MRRIKRLQRSSLRLKRTSHGGQVVHLLQGDRHGHAGNKEADAEVVARRIWGLGVRHEGHQRAHEIVRGEDENGAPGALDETGSVHFTRVGIPERTRQ